MSIPVDLIKQLREKTQASVADCKKALEKTSGDLEKAKKLLLEKGFEIAAKKKDRETQEGVVDSYVHTNGKIGVLVELLCETDFVARTVEFRNLAHEISLQVASMDPADVSVLLAQDYVKDPSKKVADLISETIAKVGENIVLKRFSRFEIGES